MTCHRCTSSPPTASPLYPHHEHGSAVSLWLPCGTLFPRCATSTSGRSQGAAPGQLQDGALFCTWSSSRSLVHTGCSTAEQLYNIPSCPISDPAKLPTWESISLAGMLSLTDKGSFRKQVGRNTLNHWQSTSHCLKFLLLYKYRVLKYIDTLLILHSVFEL